jgi:hypothetical protein
MAGRNAPPQEKEVQDMKIFLSRKHPTAAFIYKMLRFFKKTCTRQEIQFYVDQIFTAF